MKILREYIKHYGVDKLTDEFAVTVKKYDNGFVKLNYSQIDGPKFHPIADLCRGLTLFVDETNSTKVACRGFTRFYNFGEGETRDFDFSNCVVREKADGSLTMIWYDFLSGLWEISTRGMAYAEGNFTFSALASGGTFKDWILKAMGISFEELQIHMKDFPKEVTYVMEYCSPVNRVVTPYTEDCMVLLAVIDNETGTEEVLSDYLRQFKLFMKNVRCAERYEAKSGDELVKLADSLDGLKEGFVVRDLNTGKRIKIKSKTYAAVHHLRGEGVPSVSRLMEVVLANEQAELIAYFPEYKQFVEPIEEALAETLEEATNLMSEVYMIETQKDFALRVKDTKVAAIMFKARKDKISTYDAFWKMETSQQMKLMEKFL